MLHLNNLIFKHKNSGCNIIFIARKVGKCFRPWKSTYLKIKPTEHLLLKNTFLGRCYFLLISLIFNQNFLIIPWFFSKKGSIFKLPDNSLISRIAVNPDLVNAFLHLTTKRTRILFSIAILQNKLSHKHDKWSFIQHT